MGATDSFHTNTSSEKGCHMLKKIRIVHWTLTGDAAIEQAKKLHKALVGGNLLARVVGEGEPTTVDGAFEVEYERLHEGALNGCLIWFDFTEVTNSLAAA